MALPTKLFFEICDTFGDAFSTPESLKRMVHRAIDTRIINITGSTNLEDMIYALVEWIEAHDELLPRLIMGACEANSHNSKLKRLAEQFDLQMIDKLAVQPGDGLVNLLDSDSYFLPAIIENAPPGAKVYIQVGNTWILVAPLDRRGG